MKASYYNFFFPYEADENKIIAYNSFSTALALMDKPKHDVFQRFVNDGTSIDDEEFVGQLKQGCFLVDDDINELDRIKLRMLTSRFGTGSLGLTIAPTADCNFRCPYCYEKDVIKPDYMNEEVEEAIIKFVEKHMKTIASLHISWYGGEPLMNIGTVERLSRRFISLCEEHNVEYRAGMVTNGYLFTKDIAQLLVDIKISSVQITLDGDEETHNKRRPLQCGAGTFSTIMQNLIDCKDTMPPISLRINIDKNNAESAEKITKLLSDNGLIDKVKPYVARVTSHDDEYDKSSCFDTCGFSKEELQFFLREGNEESYMRHYPRSTANYCGADRRNAYVFAADGQIYKCWHDIGNPTRTIGSLLNDKTINEDAYHNYMLYDATIDKQCAKCNLLPVCMGGCPFYRTEVDMDACTTHKFVLDNFLKVIASKLKLKKDLEMLHQK